MKWALNKNVFIFAAKDSYFRKSANFRKYFLTTTDIRKHQLMKRLLNKNIFICATKDSYRKTAVTCTNIASSKRLTLR
jgi:hypothetical protein